MSERPTFWDKARVYSGFSLAIFLGSYLVIMAIVFLVLGQFDIQPSWEAP